MKDLVRVVEHLERLQADLSRLAGDWPESAARTIRQANADIGAAKAELRKLLASNRIWVTP